MASPYSSGECLVRSLSRRLTITPGPIWKIRSMLKGLGFVVGFSGSEGSSCCPSVSSYEHPAASHPARPRPSAGSRSAGGSRRPGPGPPPPHPRRFQAQHALSSRVREGASPERRLQGKQGSQSSPRGGKFPSPRRPGSSSPRPAAAGTEVAADPGAGKGGGREQ